MQSRYLLDRAKDALTGRNDELLPDVRTTPRSRFTDIEDSKSVLLGRNLLPLIQKKEVPNPVIKDQRSAFYSYDGIEVGKLDDDNTGKVYIFGYSYATLCDGSLPVCVTQQELRDFQSQAVLYKGGIALGYVFQLEWSADEFLDIAGMIYAEDASTPEVAKGIISVAWNRVKLSGRSLLSIVSQKGHFNGWLKRDDMRKITASVEWRKNAIAGLIETTFTEKDHSNGAYWFHGKDFAIIDSHAWNSYYAVGFKFTDPSHDKWGMGDLEVEGRCWEHKYQSTTQLGDTIFMRLTEEWLSCNKGSKLWP